MYLHLLTIFNRGKHKQNINLCPKSNFCFWKKTLDPFEIYMILSWNEGVSYNLMRCSPGWIHWRWSGGLRGPGMRGPWRVVHARAHRRGLEAEPPAWTRVRCCRCDTPATSKDIRTSYLTNVRVSRHKQL